MVKFPIFHYTPLENFIEMAKSGQLRCRAALHSKGTEFKDVSIDEEQVIRTEKELTGHVPTYVGFYERYRSYALNGYLMAKYDDPKVQNPNLYGSLNVHIRNKLGKDYDKMVILLIKSNKISELIKADRIRLWNTVAINGDASEIEFSDENDYNKKILDEVDDEKNVLCEVDILDDGVSYLTIPDDLELIIVDNVEIASEITKQFKALGIELKIPIIVNSLPRNKQE